MIICRDNFVFHKKSKVDYRLIFSIHRKHRRCGSMVEKDMIEENGSSVGETVEMGSSTME